MSDRFQTRVARIDTAVLLREPATITPRRSHDVKELVRAPSDHE